MNKHLLSLALLLILSRAASAQYWKLSGNSDATSTSRLGTLNSQPLRFYTENKQRMQIDAEGRVIVGGNSSSPSALFEVISTNRGVLIPRMTSVQRNAIPSPAQGLLVYQRDAANGLYYYDGGWHPVTPSTVGFANTSLSNLTPTSINQDLVPNSNNTQSLGSSTAGWKDVYMNGNVYLSGQRFLSGPADNTFTGRNAGINNSGSANTGDGFQALQSNTTGIQNTALGSGALYSNTTGNNNTANGFQTLYNTTTSNNTAHGASALYSNTTGDNNTAQGSSALYSNTTGYGNTAQGFNALSSNTNGETNTAQGWLSMVNNTTGSGNIAQGVVALYHNMTGNFNTALGEQSMYSNTTGNTNTAVGFNSLFFNTTSSFNTSVGYYSGTNCSTCTTATFLGTGTGTTDGLDNVTAVGNGATTTASNTVELGNAYVTEVRSSGVFVTTSDGRFKRDIKEDVPGLEFINKLRPVTYHYKIHELNSHLKQDPKAAQSQGETSLKGMEALKGIKGGEALKAIEAPKVDEAEAAAAKAKEEQGIRAKEAIKYTGFVAQEVEEAAKKVSYDFSGVHKPASSKDVYGLSYSEFVIPLVKAVQELSKKNDELSKKNEEYEKRLTKLEALIKSGNTLANLSGTSLSLSSAYLEQSAPNPSNGSAIIRYYVPATAGTTKLVFTDTKGSIIKSVSVNKGKGQVAINNNLLAPGSYTYTLYIDNLPADSKQMIFLR